MTNFEQEDTFHSYLARSDVLPERNHEDEVVSVARLSGGLVNHVWRVVFACYRPQQRPQQRSQTAAVNAFVACVQDVAEPKPPEEKMSPILVSMHEAAKTSLEEALGSELGLKWFVRSLQARAIHKEWIFGDLWPSSVLVHPWYGCGANLFLVTIGIPFHNQQAKKVLEEIIHASKQSLLFDATFHYAGSFVGHVAMLVVYPHWELLDRPHSAITKAASLAESPFQ
ncbi:hypothetical protein THRCLA_00552 [Thraustotheca clavata]|uniref:Uncharacterized protein n=1 Tax=Thraustotheca clavata TaxID=74557 RepID=A0A1W0AAX8_9STRA|nr:hypothetical protein THRCLA_00552 [Thraustotheca clavata]